MKTSLFLLSAILSVLFVLSGCEDESLSKADLTTIDVPITTFEALQPSGPWGEDRVPLSFYHRYTGWLWKENDKGDRHILGLRPLEGDHHPYRFRIKRPNGEKLIVGEFDDTGAGWFKLTSDLRTAGQTFSAGTTFYTAPLPDLLDDAVITGVTDTVNFTGIQIAIVPEFNENTDNDLLQYAIDAGWTDYGTE